MKPMRLIVLPMSVVASLLMGQGAVLAQPPGAIPAGQYRNDSHEAGFFFFDPVSGNDVNIDVIDNVHFAMPQGSGPGTTTETTRISIDLFGNGFFGSGCYDIAPSAFVFGSGSASVDTTITANNSTCGGPAGSLPTPFTIDATWSANAPVTDGSNVNLFDCGGYGLEERTTSQLQGASATVSISPILSSPVTAPQFQLLRADTEVIHAHSVQPDGCQPGPGIPGGAGPPPAGNYQFKDIRAGASFFDPTTNNFGFFGVTDSTQQSNPKGGPSTTTTQFQVNFNIQSDGQFVFGCFNLSPSNFSDNGMSNARLNLTIDQNTPTCFGGPSTLPLPQTLTVNWSGIAPVATQRGVGDLTCLTYRIQGTGLTTTSRASATATLSPMFSTPFTTPDQGSLETSSSRQHAEGAQQPVCHL